MLTYLIYITIGHQDSNIGEAFLKKKEVKSLTQSKLIKLQL